MDRKEKILIIICLICIASLWYTLIGVLYKHGVERGRNEVYQELLFNEVEWYSPKICLRLTKAKALKRSCQWQKQSLKKSIWSWNENCANAAGTSRSKSSVIAVKMQVCLNADSLFNHSISDSDWFHAIISHPLLSLIPSSTYQREPSTLKPLFPAPFFPFLLDARWIKCWL